MAIQAPEASPGNSMVMTEASPANSHSHSSGTAITPTIRQTGGALASIGEGSLDNFEWPMTMETPRAAERAESADSNRDRDGILGWDTPGSSGGDGGPDPAPTDAAATATATDADEVPSATTGVARRETPAFARINSAEFVGIGTSQLIGSEPGGWSPSMATPPATSTAAGSVQSSEPAARRPTRAVVATPGASIQQTTLNGTTATTVSPLAQSPLLASTGIPRMGSLTSGTSPGPDHGAVVPVTTPTGAAASAAASMSRLSMSPMVKLAEVAEGEGVVPNGPPQHGIPAQSMAGPAGGISRASTALTEGTEGAVLQGGQLAAGMLASGCDLDDSMVPMAVGDDGMQAAAAAAAAVVAGTPTGTNERGQPFQVIAETPTGAVAETISFSPIDSPATGVAETPPSELRRAAPHSPRSTFSNRGRTTAPSPLGARRRGFSGFVTAGSGKKVLVSDAAMHRGQQFLEEASVEPAAITVAAVGRTLPIGDGSAETPLVPVPPRLENGTVPTWELDNAKQPQLQVQPDSNHQRVRLQPTAVTSEAGKDPAQHSPQTPPTTSCPQPASTSTLGVVPMVESTPQAPGFAGFSTGSGKKLAISDAAKQKAAQWLAAGDGPAQTTPGGSSGARKQPERRHFQTPVPAPAAAASSSSGFGGFSTGSGKKVAISDVSRQKAAQWLADGDGPAQITPKSRRGTGPQSARQSQTPSPSPSHGASEDSGAFVGFSTGSGKKLAISDAAKRKAARWLAAGDEPAQSTPDGSGTGGGSGAQKQPGRRFQTPSLAPAAGSVGSAPGAAKKWPYKMCRDRRPRSGWQTERVPRKTQRKTQPVAAALVVAAAVRRSNRNVASRLRCQRLRLLQEAATDLLGSAPEAARSWPYPMLRNGRQHNGWQTVPDLPNLLR